MPVSARQLLAYEAITREVAIMLDMLLDQHTHALIADRLGLGKRTVDGRLRKLADLATCADQRELVRWWREQKRPWVLWFLDQLNVDPAELAR